MPFKKLQFRCYHGVCATDALNDLMVRVPQGQEPATGVRKRPVYCRRDHLNMVPIPENWDVVLPHLGSQEPPQDDQGPAIPGEEP